MNLTIFLAALALVESGNDDRAWNRESGARGRYQITRKVWRECYNSMPFKFAHDPHWSEFAAEWQVGKLKARGVPETPWDMAYAWNHGSTGWKRRGLQRQGLHALMCSCHACRVERIYNDALSDPTVLKPARMKR